MVPMTIGRAEVTEAEEWKSKLEIRIEEIAKCLRALGHSVNFMSTSDKFYPLALTVFIEQDLHLL